MCSSVVIGLLYAGQAGDNRLLLGLASYSGCTHINTVHTYIHKYILVYIYIHVLHTYINIYKYIYVRTYINAFINT